MGELWFLGVIGSCLGLVLIPKLASSLRNQLHLIFVNRFWIYEIGMEFFKWRPYLFLTSWAPTTSADSLTGQNVRIKIMLRLKKGCMYG